MATDVIVDARSSPRANVQWGAVLAGSVITTAFGLILLAFGAAIGLSLTSPYEGEGLSPVAFAIAAGLYLLWVQVMSFYFGGYVTARLSARVPDASEHEVDVRDGLHGLSTWAVATIAAFILAFAGVGGVTAVGHSSQSELSAGISRVAEKQVRESANKEKAENPSAIGSTQAERRAEIARKLSIVTAFIAAASLLVGAVASFFGSPFGRTSPRQEHQLGFLQLES